MTNALRFNTQKDEFSNKIKNLENESEKLLNELMTGQKLRDVKPRIIEFATNVNNLVDDLNKRMQIFADLAFNISSDLDDYSGVNEQSWLEDANNPHKEGIFKWMHNTILYLLTRRWDKMNLGNGNGPSAPPNYTKFSFKKYKEITNQQNRIKSNINNERSALMKQMEPLSKRLKNLSKKVISEANQPGPSQSPDNK